MSKKKLERIERQLSELDAEAMSFDHEDAEQCKLALTRIVEKAAHLCSAVTAKASRDGQEPKGWQFDHDAAIRQAKRNMPRGPSIIESKPIDVSKPARTITFIKRESS